MKSVTTIGGKKRLAEQALQLAEQVHRQFMVTLDPGVDFDIVFDQGFWANHARIVEGDIVRVRTHDGSADCCVTILSKVPGGAVVDFFPRFPPKYEGGDSELVESSRLKVVPFVNGKPAIRVDFQPGTLWRVIGLDGSMVARDMKTEEEAKHVQDAYLKNLRMEMPSEEEIIAEAIAYENAEKAKHAARAGHAHTE